MRSVLVLLALLSICEANGQQWLSLGGGVLTRDGSNSTIRAMAVDTDNNELYVWGCFDSTGTGVIGKPIMKWDGATWNNLGLQPSSSFNCNVTIDRSMLYCGRRLYYASYEYVSKASLNPFTAATIGTATADVEDLCWWNGKLVAVGDFAKMNGVTCNGIAVYDTTTQVWSALGQGINFGQYVYCCYNWNGKLVIGGLFAEVDGVSCNSVAMYDTSGGGQWISPANGIGDALNASNEGIIHALSSWNGELFAGCSNGNVNIPNLQSFDGTDWIIRGSTNPVRVLYPTDSALFVGGMSLQYYNQSGLHGFSNPLGSVWKYALASYNGHMIVGGDFRYDSNGDTLNCIAELIPYNGINEVMQNEISVAPNPAINNITLNYLEPHSSINIYNLQGQLLIKKITIAEQTEIDMSELPSGIYLLQIESKEGVVVKKVVKEAPAP